MLPHSCATPHEGQANFLVHPPGDLVQQAIAESFVYSFRLVMLVAAGLALASAVTAFLTIEGKGPPERHQPG